MTMENLKQRLLSDLSAVGVNTEESFELVLKDYSKSYYGRYYPDKKRVVVYVHEDRDLNKQFPYEQLFSTALHESVHHIQWCDPNYKRAKGVMHNPQFYALYNRLMRKHRIYRQFKKR